MRHWIRSNRHAVCFFTSCKRFVGSALNNDVGGSAPRRPDGLPTFDTPPNINLSMSSEVKEILNKHEKQKEERRQQQALGFMEKEPLEGGDEASGEGVAEKATGDDDRGSRRRQKRIARQAEMRSKAPLLKTKDDLLGDLLSDMIRAEELGKKLTKAELYRNAQEKQYEAKYGHKAPSGTDRTTQHVPYPPDFSLRRLTDTSSLLFEDDPWPRRSVTPTNNVPSRYDLDMEADRMRTEDANKDAAPDPLEEKTNAPPTSNSTPNLGPLATREEEICAAQAQTEPQGAGVEFCDAIDELTHWEYKYIEFIRDAPLHFRRYLPLLIEVYRMLTHRLVRAEKRFLATRSNAFRLHSYPQEIFNVTEACISRCRALYGETHRSLAVLNNDPRKIKKSVTGPLLSMNAMEYSEWREKDRTQRNRLIALVSSQTENLQSE